MDMGDILNDLKKSKREKVYFKEQFSEEYYKRLNVYHFILTGDYKENETTADAFNVTAIQCMEALIPITGQKAINLEKSFNDFCQKEFLDCFYLENTNVELKLLYPELHENSIKAETISKYRFENDKIFLKPSIDSLVGDENQYLEYKPYFVFENEAKIEKNGSKILLKIFFPLTKEHYNINNFYTTKDQTKSKYIFILTGFRKMYDEFKKIIPDDIVENSVQEGNFSLTAEICNIKENKLTKICTPFEPQISLDKWSKGILTFEFNISYLES